MKKICIKTAYAGSAGRRDDDFVSIALEAFDGVAGDTGDIRDVYLASYAAHRLCDHDDPMAAIRAALRTRYPGLRTRWHGLYKTGGEALFAALDVALDHDGDVVVLGAEKMTHLDPAEAAGRLSGLENDHDARYGATLPALGGLITRAYLDHYVVPETAMHEVAVKNHRHAALNPKAHFRKEVTAADVASSPLVADPLRRLHCAPISDGGAAVRLTHSPGGIAFVGWGAGVDAHLLQERADIGRFVATARAADAAREMAGIACDDIDVVEIHDAFASFELINLEEMGFFRLGAAHRALARGDLTINGKVCVNPSGGMKAKGHPIGATGLSGSAEMVAQLSGTAGARQHEGARIGMIQSVGGVSKESYVFIVAGEKA